MVNLVTKLSENLSETMAPLLELHQRDTELVWDANANKVFNNVKSVISNLSMLRLYEPNLPIVLSVDASTIGVGAVVTQNGQPLEFASRTITKTQTRYAQIEEEF